MEIAFIKMARIFHIEIEIFKNIHLKKLKKKYQKKWENAYLIVKNARASRAQLWALDPGQYYIVHFACPTSLRYVGRISEKILRPPLDQILDPLLNVTMVLICYACFLIKNITGTKCQLRMNIQTNKTFS